MTRCRWIRDPEVPGGRFLVPGCWNRVIHGDCADCHCVGFHAAETFEEKVKRALEDIIDRIKKLETRP